MIGVFVLALAIAQIAVPATQDARPAFVDRQSSATNVADQREQSRRQVAATAACHRRFMGQDYWPQPAIWKIADTDTTMYLFGTQHVIPRDFDWRSPQLDRIIDDAQLLITEGGESANSGAAGITPYPPVAERLRGDDRLLWRGMMAMTPEDRVHEYDRLPTLAVAMRIGRYVRLLRDPPSALLGVDDELRGIFRASGKKVEAIESGEAVNRRAIATSERGQRRLLSAQLRASVETRAVAERMRSTHQWGRGEPPGDLLSKRPQPVKELLDLLLDVRNADWARVLSQRMSEPGTILVAVGAGHFEGRGSLLESLAQRGLAAERISPLGPPRARAAWIPVPTSWASCDDYLFGTLPVPPGSE